MSVYAYLVAPARQRGGEEDSARSQIEKVARHMRRRGWTLNQVFIEWEISCQTPLAQRPQGRQLLVALRRGDVVIGCRADQMFRSAREALPVLVEFRKRQISLIFLDMGWEIARGDLADRVFATIDAVTRIEREQIQKRVDRMASRLRREGGCHLGGAALPFGFTASPSGALAPVEKEQSALQDIIVLRECGFSFKRIAQMLKRKGFFLSPEAVQRLIYSSRNACALAS